MGLPSRATMPVEFVAHADKLAERSYRASFRFDGEWVDEAHATMPDVVRAVPGWLRDEDVLKLYELARLSPGPILEVGAYRGKSAVVLASALRAAGGAGRLVSLDIDPDALASARSVVRERGLQDRVVFVRGTLQALVRAHPGIRPGVVFLDGDHSLKGVRRDLATLEALVPIGALMLFHDYLDERNEDPRVGHIDVLRGVQKSWVVRDCEFAGVFGCCGLYRRVAGGSQPDGFLPDALAAPTSAEGPPPLLDVVRYDTLHMRYLQRVRRPLGRWVRRRLGRDL
jgi:predicted O-methyltransferase YrrM